MATSANKIFAQGPWDPKKDPVSLFGAPALPMPVQICEREALRPFFNHLASDGSDKPVSCSESPLRGLDGSYPREGSEANYATHMLEFPRGVLYEDGRMDLCKIVLGPHHIGELMDSLRTNTFVKHFLFGNNIIGPHGAKCIAEFIRDFPNHMETWYLAGNCIDAGSFDLIAKQLAHSQSLTNLWLKRNPLGPASVHGLAQLISHHPHLRTLDLDQTGLGDEGVALLFCHLVSSLLGDTATLPLRNLYLNGNGISTNAAHWIGRFLALPSCPLESLYLSNNPLGNEGLAALAEGLKSNRLLQRLSLQSVGGSDEGVIELCKGLCSDRGHPSLRMLELGQSFATEDLGSRYNYITDTSATAIASVIDTLASPNAKGLQYFSLGTCVLTLSGLDIVNQAVADHLNLMYFDAVCTEAEPGIIESGPPGYDVDFDVLERQLLANIRRTYGEDVTYETFLREHKRWIVNNERDVRKIDSVYRNRDAQLARRGLKVLNKLWDEADDTLTNVMNWDQAAIGSF